MKRISDADLRLLRVFAAVVECEGFAGAQAQLSLSTSSISGYIAALEQRLGMRLCNRGRAGFSLTDQGAAIYREAQHLFAAMDQFAANAGAVGGRLTGTLRIGLVDSTVTDPNAPVTRAIHRFDQRGHDVWIELTIATPASLQRGVLERRLDVAIACFPVAIATLPGEFLYDEVNSFYCSSEHPLFAKPEVTLEDISAGRIIARSYWHRADLSRLGVEREAAAVDTMEAQAMLILSGAYLGYLPEHYAESWVAEGRLRRLLPEQLSYVSPFSLIVRRGAGELPLVRQFIADLRSSLPDRTAPRIGGQASLRRSKTPRRIRQAPAAGA